MPEHSVKAARRAGANKQPALLDLIEQLPVHETLALPPPHRERVICLSSPREVYDAIAPVLGTADIRISRQETNKFIVRLTYTLGASPRSE